MPYLALSSGQMNSGFGVVGAGVVVVVVVVGAAVVVVVVVVGAGVVVVVGGDGTMS